MKKTLCLLGAAFALNANLSFADNNATVDTLADKVEPKVIEWRRHFHQYPELSNREFETAKIVAKHLRDLGLEVQTGVAHTGVVAVLDSGRPGPVIGLRADMDGLPVIERTDFPFTSKAKGEYNGKEVGVMHACGHDTHMAMLMGAAEILVSMKDQLHGKVKFLFQPAEEGTPDGEEGGAKLMVEEGVLKNPDVDTVFGLHINSQTEVGTVKYKSGGVMAAVDPFKIVVHGKQSHGAYPWLSADPIVSAAQIIMGLQTVVSREASLTEAAAVVTVGSIHGGNRSNIIPEKVELVGTIRTLDNKMRERVHEGVRRKAESIAASMNTTVDISLPDGYHYPVTYNTPELMQEMLPTIRAVAGPGNAQETKAVTGAEDFSFFQEKVPGLYLFVGGMPKGVKPQDAPGHHTPEFAIDESGMKLGVRLLSQMTLDYMEKHK
jgi:amidohydrolase